MKECQICHNTYLNCKQRDSLRSDYAHGHTVHSPHTAPPTWLRLLLKYLSFKILRLSPARCQGHPTTIATILFRQPCSSNLFKWQFHTALVALTFNSAFNSLICHAAASTWTATATGTFIMIAKLSRPSLPQFVIVWALLLLLARPGLL